MTDGWTDVQVEKKISRSEWHQMEKQWKGVEVRAARVVRGG